MQSERKYDMLAEQQVNSFLCKYFYSVVFPGFFRETSLKRQLAGIDISFGDMRIDEKCQIEKLNTESIATQCLELGFINKANNFSLGWYIDPRKLTTHYLLTWVSKCLKTDKRNLQESDIIEMKAILVSVEKLKQYLESLGITDGLLHREMLDILIYKKAHIIKNNRMYIYMNRGTRIVRSLSKKEAPVNFVVPIHIYEECCDGKYVITRQGVSPY